MCLLLKKMVRLKLKALKTKPMQDLQTANICMCVCVCVYVLHNQIELKTFSALN